MSENRGGVSWFIRLLLDKRSSEKVKQEIGKTGKDSGDKFGDSVDKESRKGFQSLLRYVKGIFGLQLAREVAQALRSTGQAINAFVQKGAELDRLRTSFDSLAASAGLSGRAMLDAMKEASRGMVADLELMRQANFALQVGLPVTAESMGELVYISRRLAEATGRDATEAFQRLVQGIAKGEVEILEELGLLTRMETATNAWSKANGRSVESMTQQEKVLAFFNTVMDEARGKISGLGEDTLDAGERVAQVTTYWQNLQGAVALAILDSPGIAQFFTDMGVGADNAGQKIDELADKIGAFVDTYGAQALGVIVSAAQGALAGGAAGGVLGAIGGPIGVGAGSFFGAVLGARRGQINNRPTTTFEENLARRQADRANDVLAARYRAMAGGGRVDGSTPIDPVEAEKQRKKEIDTLIRAAELRLLSREELGKLVELEAQYRRQLADGNLSLEDRVRVQTELNQLEPFGVGRLRTPTVIPKFSSGRIVASNRPGEIAIGPDGRPLDQLSQLPTTRTPFQEYLELFAKIETASQHAAYEMASAFEDAFNLMREQGATIGNLFEGLGRGLAGSMLQGLAEFARGKIKENIAAAVEAAAYALGFTSHGNFASASAAWSSAAQHSAAAVAWAAAAGGAGAGRSAVTGGRGAVPVSTRDAGLGRAERAEFQARPVTIYVDPFNPANPVHTKQIGKAVAVEVRLGGRTALGAT